MIAYRAVWSVFILIIVLCCSCAQGHPEASSGIVQKIADTLRIRPEHYDGSVDRDSVNHIGYAHSWLDNALERIASVLVPDVRLFNASLAWRGHYRRIIGAP